MVEAVGKALIGRWDGSRGTVDPERDAELS